MKTRHLPLFLLAGLTASVLGFSTLARAQSPSVPSGPLEKKTVAYRLSKTDMISIAVINEPELNAATKRIDSSGNVNLALVGEVQLVGLTVVEAQTAIENAYKDGRILRNPQVTINIEAYAPRTVFVSGQVKFGGTINLPPETVMTLKELMNKVQLTETANASAVRIDRTLADGARKYFTKDVDALLHAKKGANPADGEFVIEPGDQVFVPEKMF